MKNSSWIIALIVVALLTAGGGYWFGAHSGGLDSKETSNDEASSTTQPTEEDKPVVPVQTAVLKSAPIAETITAYGTVAAQPSDVHAISVPFESRIQRVLVTPGEQVSKGTPIVQIQPSPDALVALQEAKNAVEAAATDLKQTEERFAEHLATNTELSQARQAAQSAQLKLDSLTQRGVGAQTELKADFAAVVYKIDVQEGQVAPAAAPLVELAGATSVEVQLNIEPADAIALKTGAEVQLQPVGATPSSTPIVGHVRSVAQRVDAAARLVEVRVSLPPDTHLLLDSAVTGQIQRAAAEGLIVPRNAALPNEDGTFSLFTVKDHHAVQHTVRIGLQNNDLVQVIDDTLKPGDEVVVTGNNLLKDGMEVEAESATMQPATDSTQPAANRTEGAP